MNVYEKLNYFAKHEFSDPDLMNEHLLYKLDDFREYVGSRCFVSSSTGGIHKEGSQHYQGNAVDVLFPEFKGSLFSLFLIAERYGFKGIGLYPYWKYNDKRVGGMHLDERPLELYTQSKRWIGVKMKSQTEYFPLNMKHLKKFRIIT